MIYKIYANDNRFKPVLFNEGFNIILADKKQESKEKDSRNGLGKTTLINIIHFLLGANLDKNLSSISEEINKWVFFIELDLGNTFIMASRAINNLNIIRVYDNFPNLPVKPEFDVKEGFYFYKIEDWKKLLGVCLYGLQNSSRTKYIPAFRTLISYSIRRGIDAYADPFRNFRSQPPWSVQVHNAFLLGLNWINASEVQDIKERKKAITGLETSIKSGMALSKGELEAKRVNITNEVKLHSESLLNFKVHPQYREIQENANILTTQIHKFSNELIMLQKKLQRYEESVAQEKAPDNLLVEQLYNESGIHFPGMLKKTLEEAKSFHSKVVQNRKNFLLVEIEEIQNDILRIDKAIKEATNDRAKLMSLLNTHGALEEYTQLQARLLEKKNDLNWINSKLLEIQEAAEFKKQIKRDKIELETKIARDYEDRRSTWEEAISIFNENTKTLYDEPGSLIIDISDEGFRFNIEIPRSSSEGVGKMKIFCYDLMLVEILSKQNKIDFLIHDSSIFDGVDSRQTAHSLELASKKASQFGFQYICSFNSDMIPWNDLPADFKIEQFVRLILTDQEPKDSLMGFRYNE
jgi:uncharacterized protein YydD (DUF2326 family)